ncbi:Chaperone protein focC precursor [Serratia fonticola]|uniref:fimbrial biogenesis chaperone n=1 Tax=Serratia fonticola TaxID=47917 RepID=UPI0021832614|nr:fimbria/pilus periplasmic chaperone [Serratia fonticola]CAI2530223.1 Chaperone protein focC precursor [Serratia fonticola]
MALLPQGHICHVFTDEIVMRLIKKHWLLLSLLLSGFFSTSLHAGIVISGTRVIYPSDAKEVTLKLENKSRFPLLVQSWIDAGDANSAPEDSDVPFMIMPPVSRVEPAKAQTLRITSTPLVSHATDRETLYWINVLEVPPQSKGDQNYLSIAYRNRLKVFYRPSTLPGLSLETLDKVSWQRQGEKLLAKNPTPYHISYASVQLSGYGIASVAGTDGGMIAPFSEQTFQLKRDNKVIAVPPNSVITKAINDYGAFIEKIYPLGR